MTKNLVECGTRGGTLASRAARIARVRRARHAPRSAYFFCRSASSSSGVILPVRSLPPWASPSDGTTLPNGSQIRFGARANARATASPAGPLERARGIPPRVRPRRLASVGYGASLRARWQCRSTPPWAGHPRGGATSLPGELASKFGPQAENRMRASLPGNRARETRESRVRRRAGFQTPTAGVPAIFPFSAAPARARGTPIAHAHAPISSTKPTFDASGSSPRSRLHPRRLERRPRVASL